MFKFLRSKAKIFYWVIAASFIIALGLGFGFGGGRRNRQQSPDVVGSVNGIPISAYEWDYRVQRTLAQLRQQNPDREVNPDQRANVIQQVWDDLVRERIEQAEIQRLDLRASRDDILHVLRNEPPPQILAMDRYRDENGNPDLEAYYADLANPEVDWSGVEAQLRQVIPRVKLQQMIISGAAVTEAEMREAYRKQNSSAVAEYLGILYPDIELDREPTEEELLTFHQAHRGEYYRPQQAKVQLVRWELTPSELDSSEVRDLALEVKRDVESGALTFEEAASMYSQDPGSSETGGDLGTFDRQRMVKPFSDAAFSLPVGTLSDPVLTDFGFHLIEVLEQTVEGDSLAQVHARHILLQIEPSEETLSGLYSRADDFRRRAQQIGFEAAVGEDSLEVYSPRPFSRGSEIPGLRETMAGSNFALGAKPGSISPIFAGTDFYYVLWVEKILPEGPAPLEDVRAQVVVGWQNEQKQAIAAARLQPVVEFMRNGEDIAKLAAEHGLMHAVTDTFTASSNIPDVGFGTVFNSVALQAEVGSIVPEVDTGRGLFALRTLWKAPFSEDEYLAQKDDLRRMLLSRKQRELIEAWYEERISRAQITDNRYARQTGDA